MARLLSDCTDWRECVRGSLSSRKGEWRREKNQAREIVLAMTGTATAASVIRDLQSSLPLCMSLALSFPVTRSLVLRNLNLALVPYSYLMASVATTATTFPYVRQEASATSGYNGLHTTLIYIYTHNTTHTAHTLTHSLTDALLDRKVTGQFVALSFPQLRRE